MKNINNVNQSVTTYKHKYWGIRYYNNCERFYARNDEKLAKLLLYSIKENVFISADSIKLLFTLEICTSVDSLRRKLQKKCRK